jgi:hypothetical protein
VVALILFSAGRAWGHKPSDGYLTVAARGAEVTGRWDVAVRDVEHALDLDADGDGAVTWGEVRRREGEIRRWAVEGVRLATAAGACPVEARALETVEHSDGVYLSLRLAASCPVPPDRLRVEYRLFAGLDPQHRGILRAEGGEAVVVAPGEVRELALAVAPAPGSFVVEGVHHIWGGLDHVLFLVALLLPSVLRREGGAWRPAPAIRSAVGDVTRIVTAFTAAHSLTLSLATLGLVTVSARVIEPAIAASVALAAVNNVRPLFGPDRWVVAFALGLLHGFGFSSVLADAGLGGLGLVRALVGFNVGVELGQLGIVALFVPAAFLARHTAAYRRLALVAGSAVITVLAFVWFVQRIVTS